jgi:hypothetical protein
MQWLIRSALNSRITRLISFLALFGVIASASAEWLWSPTLDPVAENSAAKVAVKLPQVAGKNRLKGNAITQPSQQQSISAGQAAFNAFGCGECHQNLVQQGYLSGFRVLGVDEFLDHRRPGVSAFSQDNSDHNNPTSVILLGDREYLQSTQNSSVFLRYIHQNVPAAADSLYQLDAGSEQDRAAAVEYILMF